MDVLVLTPAFLPTIGGAEIGVHEIYSRLGARHRVTILTERPRSERVLSAAPDVSSGENQPLGFDSSRYEVLYYSDFLNGGRVPGRMLLRGAIPPFSAGALWGADRHVRRARPDVVNVHYAAYVGLAALWLQRVHHIPTVLSLVGRDCVPGPLVPPLWPRYAHLVARHVTHTVFISEYCRSYQASLDARRALHPARKGGPSFSVVPYGADTKRISPRPPDPELSRTLCIPTEARVLFCLQRLTLLKHVEVCIRCVRQLVGLGYRDLVLLVGGSGPEERRLRQLVDSMGLEEKVRFLGFVPEPEVARYFSLADVFVFPSILETFGIVLAQAMAAGVPIVAASSSAVPEVVEHGVTGLLSAPLDVEGMTRNIDVLLQDEGLRQRMGQQGRQVAEQRYDWDRVALQYERILLDAANGKQRWPRSLER